MKKKTLCSNSRLYLTEDMYDKNVWFIRTDVEQIARLKKEYEWEIFFYPFRLKLRKKTVADSLAVIEKLFKEYWKSKYGNSGI